MFWFCCSSLTAICETFVQQLCLGTDCDQNIVLPLDYFCWITWQNSWHDHIDLPTDLQAHLLVCFHFYLFSDCSIKWSCILACSEISRQLSPRLTTSFFLSSMWFWEQQWGSATQTSMLIKAFNQQHWNLANWHAESTMCWVPLFCLTMDVSACTSSNIKCYKLNVNSS